MILDRIIKEKYREVEERKVLLPLGELKKELEKVDKTRGFKEVISRGEGGSIRLIAEIKHASPSKGIICREFNPKAIARIYEDHKVSAISVLTDKNFGGELLHLKEVRGVTTIPILQKDFMIDPYQIYEARVNGADAVLLIAAILDRNKIDDFISLSKELEMDSLVEVHTEAELDMVLATEAQIIGINNRNLYTFDVDLKTTLRLRPFIPPSKILVSESGIYTREEVLLLEEKGIDAILVGEAILGSRDMGAKIDELLGR